VPGVHSAEGKGSSSQLLPLNPNLNPNPDSSLRGQNLSAKLWGGAPLQSQGQVGGFRHEPLAGVQEPTGLGGGLFGAGAGGEEEGVGEVVRGMVRGGRGEGSLAEQRGPAPGAVAVSGLEAESAGPTATVTLDVG